MNIRILSLMIMWLTNAAWAELPAGAGTAAAEAADRQHSATNAIVSKQFHRRHVALGDLLDGALLFSRTVPAATDDEQSILAMDADMQAFLIRHTANAKSPGSRLRALLRGMVEEGYLTLEYDIQETNTANETFHRKTGNCLSFTNMFVALARQAGLRVNYQMVDIPPIWEQRGDYIVLDKHINVLVHNVRINALYKRDYVVDFNIADYQGNYDSHTVDDRTAFALFFSNLGVEALRQEQPERAFAYLKRAINDNPKLSAPWINIGALYSTRGRFAEADVAYRQALKVEPGSMSAMANLARLHRENGDPKVARSMEKRARYYRSKNPYYHYSLSIDAYRANDIDGALAPLKKAIRLKREEHQFHYLRALLAAKQHDAEQVQESLELAAEYALIAKVRQRYKKKLSLLNQAQQR